jgi:hypothetical protein
VKCIETDIPPGSGELAFWLNLPPGDKDTGEPIDTVCNRWHLDQHECRITKAMGTLTEEVLVEIAIRAANKGYHYMHFEVAHGSPASHWAEYQKTVDGMDYYTVDLLKQLAVYEGMK